MTTRTTVANAVAALLRRERSAAGIAVAIAGALSGHPSSAFAQGISFTTPSAQQIVRPATNVTVTVSDSDSSFEGDVSQSWNVGSPAQGTLTFPNGSCPSSVSFANGAQLGSCAITYTPKNPNFIGTDSFTVTATDTASATGSVSVTVTTYPSVPTASNFTVQTNNAAPVAWDLAKNKDITYDSIVPASQVVVTIVTPPAHGSASVSGTTITYTPNSTFVGSDSIGYQVSDGSVQNASGTMTVSVAQSTTSIPSDVVGKTQAAGSAELTGDGFTVTVGQQVSTAYPAGQVITTQPAPGTAAPRGSTVKLIVSQGPGPASGTPISSVPGLTTEQQSVARGIEQTCNALATAYAGGSSLTPKQQDLLDKCLAIISDYSGGTNVAGLQDTLNAVSGRQATAFARIPMQFAAGQLSHIGDRLSALRAGDEGFSFSGLDFGGPPGAQAALAPLASFVKSLLGGSALGGGAGDDSGGLLDNRLGVFVNGTLRRGTETSSDAESGFDFQNTGVTIGADYRLGTAYVLGVAGGYGTSETDFDDNGGTLDAKHTSVSLYGSYFNDHFHIDWIAGFGHNTYDLGRNIDYSSSSVSVGCDGSSCSTDTSGSTGARVYSASISGGADFHWGALEIGPTLGLDYKQVSVEGYTESGPSGLDLTYGGMTADSLVSQLGGYATYAWKTPWAVILPQVRLRYLHEFMNNQRTESVEFAADTLPGASARAFDIYTDQPDRDYFDWHAGVVMQFAHGIAGYLDYGGITGLQYMSMHQFDFGVRVELGSP